MNRRERLHRRIEDFPELSMTMRMETHDDQKDKNKDRKDNDRRDNSAAKDSVTNGAKIKFAELHLL